MRRISDGSLASLMVITLAACADGPMEPSGDVGLVTDPSLSALVSLRAHQSAALGANVVAAASGGVKYTLGGLDLDGDGVEDPINQRLTFTAQKDADGVVKGTILYEQEVFGERFRFKSDVSCINVYDGNRVKFGGPITQSNDPTVPVGLFMWFHSLDHGQGAAAAPDQTTGLGLGDNAANEAFCNSAALPNPRFLSDVTAGNLMVSG
jgi:hypothetical protein